ncbi:DnaJ C-terminal domain-containing protein [Stratiformator vulcanicus]|uniref:Curved DNA-binding protein n=1 Tax=Stratiformator vulcanicus TaxID=2527980 RepID=A0A517QVX0_9PLAN|nr:DnaJ C-terminal domain-containing protein [Stratiformator vulcanicus]QDT35713.1 Curved DNA-binding protein [Stratiformator vulcanicus]
MAEDYYKTLGVSREASADEIRKAYRKLARENHPDVKPDDKAAAKRFKEIQEAYSVLGSAEKRTQYDRYGHAFQGAPGGGGGQYRHPGGGGQPDLNDIFGEGFDLGDLFGGAFGGGASSARGPRAARPRQARGADARAEITVPFTVAAEGGKHDLRIDRDGKPESISIKVPAGIKEGGTIRLAGQGQPGYSGGPAGDLLITIHIAAHPHFRREGSNLLVDVPVTPSEAVLGAKVEVPTLSEGTLMLTIPPGTSSGKKLRLRGKGVIDPKTKNRGDQFVVVKIVVPEDPTDDHRKLYEELKGLETDPRENLWQ